MSNVKVIGFSGLAGSGKDTAAKMLMEEFPNFKKLALADAVKDVTAILFGWERKMLTGDTVESRKFRETKDAYWSEKLKKDFTPRLAMQLVGTECFRNGVDPSFWVYVVQNKIQQCKDDTVFLIPDVRFPNEIQMIHDLGGFVCRIFRGKTPSWVADAIDYNRKLLTNKDIQLPESLIKVHVSERSLVGLNLEDHLVYNNGSFEELKKSLLNICSPYGLCPDKK